ncbi:DNA-binding transcriptional repressor GlpR [Salmonella enterica subsp. arizonae]|uniref:DNA-binding transcriptional repressor GlpR n=1 Tax=Salmonella enterica subsp. arizonae TaxID=59203 RepID=A0A379T5C9_SALER|nr:DNA-binding transcriptional repressor GlpR [Salmonella enterica subsp. arizonae]
MRENELEAYPAGGRDIFPGRIGDTVIRRKVGYFQRLFMKQTQRHDAIIELVKKQGYVSTEELVEHFSVSPQNHSSGS